MARPAFLQPPGGPAQRSFRPARAVSIIVLCHDRWEATRRCLRSLRRSTPPELYELLVYDNASSDGTLAGLRRLAAGWPQLRVFANAANLPFSRAVNRGMRDARGRSFLWLNNDTVLSPGWLEGLLQAARSGPRVGAAGPLTDNMAPPRQVSRPFANRRSASVEETAFLGGFCFLLKRAAAARTGLLDERFVWGWEDMDYCLRLRQAGFSLSLARNIFVHHVGNKTIETMPAPERRRTDERNRALIRSKWLRTLPWRGDLMGLMEKLPDPRWNDPAPKASVVVVCGGPWKKARASLEAVRRSAGPAAYEVVAAAMGAPRETARGLKALAREWPELRVLGPWRKVPWGHAVNLALKRTRGENLAVLADGARVRPGWLEELVSAAGAGSNIGLVGPDGDPAGPPWRGDSRTRPATRLRSGCLLMPRRTFEKIGGFDDRFAGALSLQDYCLRVRHAGYQVLEARHARVRPSTDPAPALRPLDKRLLFAKWSGHRLLESEMGR